MAGERRSAHDGRLCRGDPIVRPEDVAESIACGPDLDGIVEAVRAYWEAGFTDIALVQIGGDSQDLFFKEAAEPMLAAMRAAAD